MQYKIKDTNSFVEIFTKIIATINLVTIMHFFETICYSIFKYLLAANSKNREFFSLVSTYFGIIETNSQEILYLYYLV